MTIVKANGVVSISYPTLVSSPTSLQASIEEAFGSHPTCLGLILVRDLPPIYQQYRERLLKLSYKFAKLDENTREKYTDSSSRYSFGWSHGKEIMNGKPDFLKGSYYANISVHPTTSQTQKAEYPEYYGDNIWPDANEPGVQGFKEAFEDLGRFIFNIGCQLAEACQPFTSAHLSDPSLALPTLIKTSQTTKARLLHYFPPGTATSSTTTTSDSPAQDEPIDSWCGFHLDHSLLTGLCSAMYLQEPTSDSEEPTVVPSSPWPSSGLYIRTRGADLTKVSIPPDCLAFQTGEALQLATAGKLRATPHCVRVGASDEASTAEGGGAQHGRVSRQTFALFMQPNTDALLTPTISFGQFSKRIFDEHYESSSM